MLPPDRVFFTQSCKRIRSSECCCRRQRAKWWPEVPFRPSDVGIWSKQKGIWSKPVGRHHKPKATLAPMARELALLWLLSSRGRAAAAVPITTSNTSKYCARSAVPITTNAASEYCARSDAESYALCHSESFAPVESFAAEAPIDCPSAHGRLPSTAVTIATPVTPWPAVKK